MALQIAILGVVEPRVDGVVVGVPPGKQRALLTLLALRAPYPVSAESAADALWPRAAPAEAMRSLQVTVSRLRRSLGAVGSAVETVPSGYRLAVEPDAIDARRFETLVGSGRAARLEGDGATARRLLDEALALWRGPALADVAYESFAQGEIARLEELRLAAVEERIDVRLSAGSTCSSSPSSNSSSPSIRRASGWSANSCWPCIGAVARATRWRSTRGAGDGWTRSSDSNRRRCCGASRRRSCATILRSSRTSAS